MKYILMLFVVVMMSSAVRAETIYNPDGLWLTQNERSVIEVYRCDDGGDHLCGMIYWIIDGGMQTDAKNPNAALRKQKMCGLKVMSKLSQSKHNGNYWLDGKIYKADDGDTYDAKIQMISNDEMSLRGYRGISLLGKSQMWKRVNSQDYPKCK